MNLEKNYKLLDVVRDDGIRTFQAKEIASGRALQIHLFVRSEDHALFEQVSTLPLSARRPILEFGDELRIPYFITDPLPEDTDARTWANNLLTPPVKVPESKPQPIKASVWKTGTPLPDPLFPPEPAVKDEPGEFTRMFQVPAPPAQVETKVASPAKDEPGEFTRMFQVTPPPPAAAAAFDPEATLLFKIPEPTPPPAPPIAPETPPPDQSGPGEFTRFFQSPLSPTAPGANAAPATPFQAPAAASPPPPNRPGEFTQMFGSPSGKPPSPAAPLGSGVPFNGSATGAFTRPVPPPAGQSAPKPQSHGQFTQMMSASSAPTLGQQQPSLSAPVAKPKSSNLPLIIVLAALVLFAILIVVFFATRH